MTDIRDIARERFELLCTEYVKTEGVSQAELARRMSELDQTMTRSKLGKLLALQLQIRLQEAATISEFFNVSIAWLCGESEIRQKLTPEVQTALRSLLEQAQPKA